MAIIYRNDELSSMISRDLQKIVKILLKMSVISILFNFHVSGSPESVSKQPTQLILELYSSLRHIIVTLDAGFKRVQCTDFPMSHR